MFDPGDQWTFHDVGILDLCIFHWYEEICWPFFSDLFHVFIGQLIVGLYLLLAFILVCGDVNKVLIYAELRLWPILMQIVRGHSCK
jgi:hypothetical protein